MNAGVVATLGYCNTGVAAKSLEVFQNAKLPLIIPCATGTPLTAQYPAASSYIFRTAPRRHPGPYVVNDLGATGLDPCGHLCRHHRLWRCRKPQRTSRRPLASHSLKPVHVARFPLGVKDLQSELRAAGCRCGRGFQLHRGCENATIANGRKALKWNVPQVGAWPLSFPFINGAKDAAEGAMMAQTFIAEPSNERRASFLTAYKRKFPQTHGSPHGRCAGDTMLPICWRLRCLAFATATLRV